MEDNETPEEHDPMATHSQIKPASILQEKLLTVFEQLPTDVEKEKIITMIEMRLQELDDFAQAYLQKRNLIPPTK